MADKEAQTGGERQTSSRARRLLLYGVALFGPAALLVFLESAACWPANVITNATAPTLHASVFFLRMFFLATGFLGLVAVPICLFAAIDRYIYERRHPGVLRESARMFTAALVFGGATVALFIDRAAWGPMQIYAITHVPVNLQPLLDGLETYKSKHGAYPTQLDALVPDVLGGLPSTGYPVYPKYGYRPPPVEDPDAHFHIYIRPPVVGFEYPPGIAYCPDENHPSDAHHYLSKIRVDDWVYSPYEYRELSNQTGRGRIWDDGMRIRE